MGGYEKMSDKADTDRMDRMRNSMRDSVANTLFEAIRMFDAVPMSNDVTKEHWLPSYAMRAAMFHHALELGMKCMCVDDKTCVDGDTCVESDPCAEDDLCSRLLNKFGSWSHNLVKIYNGLSKSNRDMRNLLDSAFEDARSFYGVRINREEWKHMRHFERYLHQTAGKDSFRNFRYWYFEGDSDLFGRRMPELLINREMVRFISDVLNSDISQTGEDLFVSKLVDQEILGAFQKGCEDNGNSQQFNEYPEALEENFRILWQWAVNEHDSLLLAIKDAYEHDFDVLNDWGNTVLKSVYNSLKANNNDRTKLALKYKLSTFGAKSSDCEAISSAQVRQVGRRGIVKTPSGSRLGNITERHDGLWMAEEPRTSYSQLAFGRDDAVGLVIEKVTDIVSVALNGGTPKEARVLFPNRLELYIRDYLRDKVLCEFWDANHGIVVGDEINISGTRQDETRHIPRIRGIVKSVNNHEVTIIKTP